MTQEANYFRSLITLHTQTSLHPGVLGGTHIIDRPIHRDIHTNDPKVSSNALKGAIKEQYKGLAKNKMFGIDQYDLATINEKDEHGQYKGRPKPGLIFFTDVRLLFFPVKSKAGGWAWVSCPRILNKFRKEAGFALSESGNKEFYAAFNNSIDDQAIYAGSWLNIENYVVLYRHSFQIDNRLNKEIIEKWQKSFSALGFCNDLAERVVIVSNENFDSLTRLYSEVITRNKIDDQVKSVSGGALFTEEYLPANSLLYALSFSMPNQTQNGIEKMLTQTKQMIQLGGNATIGKGICKLDWHFPVTKKTL